MFENSEINITEALWLEILNDSIITSQKVLEILFFLLQQPKQEASGKDIAVALNYKHHAVINQIIPNFSKAILKKYTFINISERDDGTKRFWHILSGSPQVWLKYIWYVSESLRFGVV